MSARQLGLPFLHDAGFLQEDFVPAASNAAARAWLAAEWPGGRLALWGEEGTGKTHLLHAWAYRAGAAVLYGPELRRWHAEARARVAPWALAVDDADLCADEAVLLHLLNAASETGQPVLLAGREPPSRWPASLPDLGSRLRAVAAVALGPAEDGLLRTLLTRLLSERQMVMPDPLQDWLLRHVPRTPGTVREAVARLDRWALARGGPINRALVAELVEALTDIDASETAPSPPSPSEPQLF